MADSIVIHEETTDIVINGKLTIEYERSEDYILNCDYDKYVIILDAEDEHGYKRRGVSFLPEVQIGYQEGPDTFNQTLYFKYNGITATAVFNLPSYFINYDAVAKNAIQKLAGKIEKVIEEHGLKVNNDIWKHHVDSREKAHKALKEEGFVIKN